MEEIETIMFTINYNFGNELVDSINDEFDCHYHFLVPKDKDVEYMLYIVDLFNKNDINVFSVFFEDTRYMIPSKKIMSKSQIKDLIKSSVEEHKSSLKLTL